MTVQDLIDELMAVKDKSRLVILQEDPEGNGYRKLRGLDDNCSGNHTQFNRYEIGLEELSPDLMELGYTKADVLDGEPVVVLFP